MSGRQIIPCPLYYGKYESATALSDMAEEVYRQTDRVIDEIQPHDVAHLDMYSFYQKLDADVSTYTVGQQRLGG